MNARSAGQKKVVTFGEVLLRLSTPSFSRFTQAQQFNVNYAGSEANVSQSLQNFGIPSLHVTRFPDNDLGHAAVQTLGKNGLNTDHIIFGDERMGLYFLENGAMQRASRIIYDRFDSAFAHIKPGQIDWEEIFKNAAWFHYTGITPAISQGAADVCMEAVVEARKQGVTISGDINYRRNLWQYGKTAKDIMPALIALTDIVIAGITDMENCCDITGDTYEKACIQMRKKFPSIQKLATTMRESVSSSHNKISAVMWNGHQLLTSKQFDLTHIVDRIGAGDAFMAGLIYGLITKKDDQQSLEFAVAACAWKHGIEGDVNLASASEIENLVKGENIGKLLR
jgi:2-dehydro-3-deoxygluconokinase